MFLLRAMVTSSYKAIVSTKPGGFVVAAIGSVEMFDVIFRDAVGAVGAVGAVALLSDEATDHANDTAAGLPLSGAATLLLIGSSNIVDREVPAPITESSSGISLRPRKNRVPNTVTVSNRTP